MTDQKFVPITFIDNTSSDPYEPNGTRGTAARLNYVQSQYKFAAGVQVLDELPAFPEDNVNVAILSTDGRLYLYMAGAWHKVALED